MKYRIPFIKPAFPSPQHLSADYQSIVESNWFTNFGPFEQEFSRRSSQFLGDGMHVTTISNATLGLEAAIDNVFTRSGKKKVIMPSFTFAAGAEALIRAGYMPEFIDIDENSWQPSVTQATHILNDSKDQVAGILFCNIFGVGSKTIGDWEKLAKKYNVPLIIDSAAGFGSQYSDKEMVGTRGDCEIFSMHATKPFAVGEGGLVVSRNEELIKNIRSWQNFGFESDRNIHRIGTNAKFQEINAAIGLRQLEGYEQRLKTRRASLGVYHQLLNDGRFEFQENDMYSTVPFVSVLLPNATSAERAYKSLHDRGVEARRYYAPLHLQEKLDPYVIIDNDLSVTEDIASRILSLPLHDDMDHADIEFITDIIKV